MKNLFSLLVFFFFFLPSEKSFSQWIPANGDLSYWQIAAGLSIDAVDSNCAVISTRMGIYRTINGGNGWEIISPPNFPSWGDGWDISMIDSLHIWIGSGDGKIYSTSDGGKNWTIQFYDTTKSPFMNYVKMFDLQNGIAMGDGMESSNIPLFLKTTDGGIHWTSISDSALGYFSGDTWRRLDFVSLNVGFYYESGINPQSFYKTTDGCKTWMKMQTPLSVHVLKFYDENLGLTLGIEYDKYGTAKGSIVSRTTNGGDSWATIILPEIIGWGCDIEFLKNDASKVWLTHYNGLFFSSDSGKTWGRQQFPIPQPPPDFISPLKGRDLVFTDNLVGWFLCDSMVYRNTRGDHMYPIVKVETENFSPTEFSLEQNYPNPFNPNTVISWQLAVGTNVTLKIYDVLGNEIATLVNEEQQAGTHNYELEMTKYKLSGGVYYYTLKAANFVQSKGMIYLK